MISRRWIPISLKPKDTGRRASNLLRGLKYDLSIQPRPKINRLKTFSYFSGSRDDLYSTMNHCGEHVCV